MKASSSGTRTSRTSAGAAKASTSNYFELFGVAPAFGLDAGQLEQAYRDLQSVAHPDRFVASGDAQRRASLQLTTRINEAYRTLRDPVQRAKHLLELHGVDVAFETNTQMPTDFLLQQLEMRESLDAAKGRKDAALLDALRNSLLASRRTIEASIGESIDRQKDYAGAAELVRKLMFLQKMDDEIDAAYEAIE